jgi:hypothetical protein
MAKAHFDGTAASLHSGIRDAINVAIRRGGECRMTVPEGARIRIQHVRRQKGVLRYHRPGQTHLIDVPPGAIFEWSESKGETRGNDDRRTERAAVASPNNNPAPAGV